MAEFGLVAPRGVGNIEQLWEVFTECAESLPELVVSTTAVLFERVDELNAQLNEVDKQMRRLVRESEELRRLTTIPGVGEVTALAVHAFAPSMNSFARGRDFAAWIGLDVVPAKHELASLPSIVGSCTTARRRAPRGHHGSRLGR